ncbi:MAG: hypothetical protein AAF570_01295, partial [Bacteroidota bacterium]
FGKYLQQFKHLEFFVKNRILYVGTPPFFRHPNLTQMPFNKYVLGLILLLCGTTSLRGQVQFQHSIGACIMTGSINNERFLVLPLSYDPRIHLASSPDVSLSIGLPLSLGFGVRAGTQYAGERWLALDLPLMARAHFFMGATKESDKKIGVYAGLGPNYAYTGGSNVWGTYGGSIRGFAVELGANFRFTGIPVGIRMKMTRDVRSDPAGLFLLGLMYHIGY